MPIIGGSGAYYMGVRCPLSGGQVLILEGSGAHYRGFRCPLLVFNGHMPIKGGQVP